MPLDHAHQRSRLASAGRAGSKKSVSSEYAIEKTRDSGFDPLISLFVPCYPCQKSAGASETYRKPNKTAHSHTSPSRLQNEHPLAEQRAKNAWQAKCSKSARARSADTAAPRGTVRGKPAYATGAFLALAPALLRRRPRRTARRAKRPSPQPSRRRRGTTLLNSLREAAHVKKPPRTKNNCSSTCWSGGDGLGSPAMITNEARAARTSSPARRRRRFAGAKRGPWSRNLPTRPVR